MIKKIKLLSLISLLAFSLHANAALTCPAGQTVKWHSVDQNYPNGYPCENNAGGCVATSPEGVCAQYDPNNGPNGASGYTLSDPQYAPYDDTQGQCSLAIANLGAGARAPGPVVRSFCETTPQTCSIPAGTETGTLMAAIDSSGNQVDNGQYCYQHCTVNVQGVGLTFGGPSITKGPLKYVSTGAVCNDADNQPTNSGNLCSVQNGQTVCTIANQPCVRINGDLECKQDLLPPSDHTVKQTASGGVLVNSTNTTGAPDNGTPGVPAAPSLTLTDSSTNVTDNYYGPDKVNASTKGPACPAGQTTNSDGSCSGTSVCPYGTSKNAAGQCVSDSTGKCGADGQPDCSVKQKAKPGTYNGPSSGDADSFGTSFGNFKSRVAGSALAGSLTAFQSGIPTGGAAPTAGFDVFGHHFVIDTGPALNGAASTLHALFLCLFALGAVILFFKA